ncbi:energy-coupling factor transporter transmembrane protein EcfT [Shewanella sp. D64]|uniref:energy-coupling factor transporter transmembrane component T n=1 Tax=unclassified Shewanella TaxID=196818 RepID=UPI0022BA396B|nr:MULTISPECIES: energy-coupling factor transporter transmembrane component T [unclassified Shewanella]MEC4727574.1 energy-coupling factor transporter transmembrane protein EcfT [Shewanella sp. D64]MEC4739825.1 energy-coupling factor transporter transmembrane protein EcfT [Shewanella sp. E94]WBJ95789.1 energy-coupling factor transporter transmembrane protein EcfT [Shewanella sp. MTB7]
MKVRGGRHFRHSVNNVSGAETDIKSSKGIGWTGAALILALVLSSGAFFIAEEYLLGLIICNLALIIHGVYRRGDFWVIGRVFFAQLVITLSLYYLMHGKEQLVEGATVVLRVLMAFIPGWWLSVTCLPEKIAEVLAWILPVKWAFVIAASLSLLPTMTREIREIYQIQCLRGARITPKALKDPRNWSELIHCVIFPLLIQLLKLSKQTAMAAQLRHFGKHKKPTHWR